MAKLREPPAYQEYSAKMMSSIRYRTMSLASRGLMYSLRLECWENHRLPADPATLARLLHYSEEEVAAALPEVMPFFDVANGFLFSPELENYREELAERRVAQAEGGKKGAAKTNAKHRSDTIASAQESKASGKPRPTRRGARESLVQSNSVQASAEKPGSIHALNGEPISQGWVNDYERASNGY